MGGSDQALYDALAARDARFDGLFFVGVTSTGIYCRPVCTAKTPKRANCRFFENAAAAEKASFRPCLRCRPELAPGRAPIDGAQRIATRIADRIGEGLLDEGGGLERVAKEFHFSARQIRRIVRNELGVSPIELVQTRRLLLAKQLLTETTLPVIEIAYASGFASLRRFNDAFVKRYGMPPTRLRAKAVSEAGTPSPGTITLRLSYRPPYDWSGMLAFLEARALSGVEWIGDGAYHRTVELGGRSGWIRVRHSPAHNALLVDLAQHLTPVLPALLGRLRDVFDLNARPDVITAHLAQDPLLRDTVLANPGLRTPGSFDGFELAMRAILGQQITVKAATTLAGRIVHAMGAPIATPYPQLTHLAPTAARVGAADVAEIAHLGVVGKRSECLVHVAGLIADGTLTLHPGGDPEDSARALVAIPGIGPWTAQYIALRALRWPDAFPKEDVVLRNRLGGITAAQAEARADVWRPWRSYATLHLWRM
jgi:AraC family transcriptional regulator of adaptative response / DNA-3-methyladenine glycosylase II